MTALHITNPGAISLFDLGVRCKPRSDTTCCMIAAFDSVMSGTFFDEASLGAFPFVLVLTLFIFKAPNYVLARTLTERVG